MTDHRGSKQGLWTGIEEDENDRPTLPVISTAHLSSDEEVTAETELDGAIELLRMSVPPEAEAPAGPAANAAPAGTMSPEAIDSVARFISDPSLVAQNAPRSLDAPSRSLAALELLDAEYGAEPTDVRPPPQPPPPPGSIRPPSSDLPSIVLSAHLSPRGDQTERTNAIPLTHPLANSIAPGGSAVSTPPARPRRTGRWQIALGVGALLVIGAGASRFLQSRGEHHAASGLPSEREEREEATRPDHTHEEAAQDPSAQKSAPEAPVIPAAPPMPSLDPQASETTALTATAPSLPSSAATRPENVAPRAVAKKGNPLRVAVGGVRMLDRNGQPTSEANGPDRAQVIAAMNAMTEQLRSCVGDEHGVADVTLMVRAPGIVSHALVEGSFAGSEKGSCIARTLRSARLPRFEEASRIEYPFQL